MKQIKNVMASEVEVLRPQSSIREAATKMKRFSVGALPVCEGDRVLGMITDRDIAVRVVAEGRDFDDTRASDVMSQDLVFCYEDQTLAEAAERMKRNKVGRLIVFDRDQHLKGLISLGDLTKHVGENRLAGLVYQKLEETEGTTNAMRRVALGILASLGIASIATGAIWARRRSQSPFKAESEKKKRSDTEAA